MATKQPQAAGLEPDNSTIVKVTAAPGWIDVPVRVDDSVALRLAMHAHESGVTLNDLMVALVTDMVERSHAAAPRSRNAREGHYVGSWRGCHVRSPGAWPTLSRRRARRIKQQRLKKKLERNHD